MQYVNNLFITKPEDYLSMLRIKRLIELNNASAIIFPDIRMGNTVAECIYEDLNSIRKVKIEERQNEWLKVTIRSLVRIVRYLPDLLYHVEFWNEEIVNQIDRKVRIDKAIKDILSKLKDRLTLPDEFHTVIEEADMDLSMFFTMMASNLTTHVKIEDYVNFGIINNSLEKIADLFLLSWHGKCIMLDTLTREIANFISDALYLFAPFQKNNLQLFNDIFISSIEDVTIHLIEDFSNGLGIQCSIIPFSKLILTAANIESDNDECREYPRICKNHSLPPSSKEDILSELVSSIRSALTPMDLSNMRENKISIPIKIANPNRMVVDIIINHDEDEGAVNDAKLEYEKESPKHFSPQNDW